METVIARRFRGPQDSANGGYACGLLGRSLDGSVRVRLHRPPPLEHAVTLARTDGGALRMTHDRRLVAEGEAATMLAELPAPISFEDASAASARYRWAVRHPFPGCFVCGPEREPGDGLRIFPGAIPGRALVAAPWVPGGDLCDDTGRVLPEIVWAALDCPSWFGVLEHDPQAGVALLGELTARVLRRPLAGQRCVITGWSRGRDGRKRYGAAAIHSDDGTLLAASEAIWIELRR